MKRDDSKHYPYIGKRLGISLFKIITKIVIRKATKKLSLCVKQLGIEA